MSAWAGYWQIIVAFLAGAWVYACGCKQGSPFPLADVVGKVGELIQARREAKDKAKRPGLPGQSLI